VACLWWEELKKAGAVIPTANAVVARLLATARTGVFAEALDPADRGAGIVAAPA
jgi:hypothetical protein